MRPMDEKLVAEMVDRLAAAEYRLSRLILNENREVKVHDIASVLHDLAAIRLSLEEPVPHDKRIHGRIHEPAVAVVRGEHGGDESVAVHDISAGGALVEFDKPRQVGDRLAIELPGLDKDVMVTVRAVRGNRTHVSFVDLPPDDLVALLKYLERHFERY